MLFSYNENVAGGAWRRTQLLILMLSNFHMYFIIYIYSNLSQIIEGVLQMASVCPGRDKSDLRSERVESVHAHRNCDAILYPGHYAPLYSSRKQLCIFS